MKKEINEFRSKDGFLYSFIENKFILSFLRRKRKGFEYFGGWKNQPFN